MYTIKKLLYLLFSFITALGMVLCWFNYFDKPSEPTTTTIKLQSLSGTIIKQKQENLLLSLSPIKNISIDKNYLVAGDDSLSFETDTIQSVAVYLPNKPEVWKNYWSALLGESVQSENFSRWNIALMRLKVALLPEWEKLAQQKLWAKLSDEQRLTYVLVSTIKSNSDYSFFIDGKNLQKTSRNNLKIMDANNLAIVSQPLAPKSQKSLSPLLFGLLTLLSGAAGLFFTKQLPVLSPNIQEIKQEEKPTTETQQLSPINTEEPPHGQQGGRY